MSKSLNSPTARLLQSSRLFSLPRPLPQPQLETPTSTGVYRASDSATTPYPTYQAIATPASSHYRGDWGLKRPLPSRSTKSSTAHIRVKAQDNFAHITDFESAANHTQTEAKWRQMGVPMMIKEQRQTYSNEKTRRSVYDENVDNTDPEAVLTRGRSNVGQENTRGGAIEPAQWRRWKYDSPWIAGMQPGEFEIYVNSRLESRRGEFRDFMIKRLVRQRIQDAERRLRDLGQRRSISLSQRNEILQDVMANYETEEKRLRDEHAQQNLASELTAAICDFLDLPGVLDAAENQIQAKTREMNAFASRFATETAAPPSTHPGAGISHLRTNAIMENHPFWGPQAVGSPVLARVLRPRNNAHGSEHQAKLGVGGIVANDKSGDSNKSGPGWPGTDPLEKEVDHHYLDAERMTSTIDPDLRGGNKIWVHPETATVDDGGAIRLQVSRGDKEAIAVSRNEVDAIHQAKFAAQRVPNSTMSPPRGTAGNANYGYGLPNKQYAARRSHVQGFDEQPRDRRTAEEEGALRKIMELAPKRQ